MNSRRPPIRGSSSQGFALIEALIGVLIFSIGVLGLVGLQATMTKAQTQARFRAEAATLTGDLIGVMWADVPNLAQYNGGNCAGYPRCKAWADKAAALLPSANSVIAVAGSQVTVTLNWTVPGETASRYVTVTAIQ